MSTTSASANRKDEGIQPVRLYRALIDQICTQCGIRNPETLYDAATNLQVNETSFSLYYGGNIDPFSALVYADFGALPSERQNAVLLRLLETNMYMFGVNSPSFTYNPENQHVLLMFRVPLVNASADGVLEILEGIAELAAGWRKDYYLLDEGQGSSTVRDASKRTVHRVNARIAQMVGRGEKNDGAKR